MSMSTLCTDISEFIIVLKSWIEGGGKDESDYDKFYYQNQLYGCFIVLEMLAEGDMSGDIEALQFENLGQLYGFYDGSGGVIPKSITNARNTGFRKIWEWAFKEIGVQRRLEDVDRIEKEVFADIDGLVWFREALQMGTLSEETMCGVRKILAGGGSLGERKRFKKTRKRG